MDVLLGKLTSQAMNYAIRSGITITATYALNQCGRLLQQTPRNDHQRQELIELQKRLESKIRIISPAIEMIELVSLRGNTTLESAVGLTKNIRVEIQGLGRRVAGVVDDEGKDARVELGSIILAIKALLVKIEDAIPLINLAITASGVNLTTKLSGTISPSRLLQASAFLVAADTNYTAATQIESVFRQQVGPVWTLTLYMLFAGHVRAVDEIGMRETTWKEVIHKARVKLVRVPLEELYALPGETPQSEKPFLEADLIMESDDSASEFAYQLLVIEDLDDGRVHTFETHEAQPDAFEGVRSAGIRDVIPIHEISKIFYADTGKILNIGSDDEVNNPVLLIKRDVHAEPPRGMLKRSSMSNIDMRIALGEGEGEQSEIDAQIRRESMPCRSNDDPSKWTLPEGLDPEWMAFEVHMDEIESESEDEDEDLPRPQPPPTQGPGPGSFSLTTTLSRLNLNSTSSSPSPQIKPQTVSRPNPQTPAITTTLSLLETLLKLTSLQQFRQQSHLSISDELLNFFLEDSSTSGAGPDKHLRRQFRNEAVRRLGFDPYDESPVKRRGEEYIAGVRGGVDEVGGVAECGSCGSPLPSPSSLRDRGGADTPSTPLALHSSPPIRHRGASYGLPKAASQSSLLATPPSTMKSKLRLVRAQSEQPKLSSPLSKELDSGLEDVGRGDG